METQPHQHYRELTDVRKRFRNWGSDVRTQRKSGRVLGAGGCVLDILLQEEGSKTFGKARRSEKSTPFSAQTLVG
jgi:hypothetical protein